MNKQKNIQDDLLEARLADAVRIAQEKWRPHFVGFLDEREAELAKRQMKAMEIDNYVLWGGYPEAERVLFGAFPEYSHEDISVFPLCAVTARFRKEDTLSHRDFLGALLSQGVQRETIGDILTEPGRCVLFLREEVLSFLLQQTSKIGRTGIRWQEGAEPPYPPAHLFQEGWAVVASPRLDCVAAAMIGLSREKTADMIRAGLVSLDHQPVDSVSVEVKEGAVLSIRGKGRFVLDRFGSVTKKGRLNIFWRKYV